MWVIATLGPATVDQIGVARNHVVIAWTSQKLIFPSHERLFAGKWNEKRSKPMLLKRKQGHRPSSSILHEEINLQWFGEVSLDFSESSS